jgi:hypothetical protein
MRTVDPTCHVHGCGAAVAAASFAREEADNLHGSLCRPRPARSVKPSARVAQRSESRLAINVEPENAEVDGVVGLVTFVGEACNQLGNAVARDAFASLVMDMQALRFVGIEGESAPASQRQSRA